jgi:class 3 adenylate cyclase
VSNFKSQVYRKDGSVTQIPATQLVDLLNKIFSVFDHLTQKHGLEKIKTIGDAYMVVGGLPTPRPDHAEAVVEMALDMQQAITRFQRNDGKPFHLRIGINTGPVVAGVIGTKKFAYDLWGDTVNVASRMESQGVAGSIQVTVEAGGQRSGEQGEDCHRACTPPQSEHPETTGLDTHVSLRFTGTGEKGIPLPPFG